MQLIKSMSSRLYTNLGFVGLPYSETTPSPLPFSVYVVVRTGFYFIIDSLFLQDDIRSLKINQQLKT